MAVLDTYDRLRRDAIAAAAAATNDAWPATPAVSSPPAVASPPALPHRFTGAAANRPGTDAEVARLRTRLESPERIWWTDLIQGEMCLMELLDDSALRARLSGWRRRMHEVIGEVRFAQYIATAPDPGTAPIDAVRADLGECIRAVYYFYGGYGVAARSRSDVTQSTFIVAAVIIAVLGVLATSIAAQGPPRLFGPTIPSDVVHALEYMIATAAAAVLGSIVSVQTRLQDPRVEVDPYYRYVQTHADKLSIAFVAPIFAAIFGCVIFGLMGSGLTGGSAFPKIPALLNAPTLENVTLLLMYGFLAGFAERLVPDALNRLAANTLASIGGGSSVMNLRTEVSKLHVSTPSITVKSGARGPITATLIGSYDDMTAVSSDTTVLIVVPPETQKGPGPVTFEVEGKRAGHTTVSIKSGTQTATVNVEVAP